MKKNLSFFTIVLLLACTTGEKQTLAHITQRRIKTGGGLVISYQFIDGKQLVRDSAEVSNRVIPHDSVKVAYSAPRAGSSRLILP